MSSKYVYFGGKETAFFMLIFFWGNKSCKKAAFLFTLDTFWPFWNVTERVVRSQQGLVWNKSETFEKLGIHTEELLTFRFSNETLNAVYCSNNCMTLCIPFMYEMYTYMHCWALLKAAFHIFKKQSWVMCPIGWVILPQKFLQKFFWPILCYIVVAVKFLNGEIPMCVCKITEQSWNWFFKELCDIF